MSTIAAHEPHPEPAEQEVTWRDAVTPMSRASRRRWTVTYALLLVLLLASALGDTFAVDHVPGSGPVRPLILLIAVPVVFGMLRRGTRRVTALDHPDLDERDIAARNAAYRVAFPLLVLVLLATLVMLMLALPDMEHRARVAPNSYDVDSGWFLGTEPMIAVAVWLLLWAVYLPTGALAWREPDALEPAFEGRGLGEPIRDALLGSALVVAIALSLIEESNAPAMLFVAALALLGALARRAAGRPVMSRQRKLRVAIGIGLILLVAALAVAFAAGGGSTEGGLVDRPTTVVGP